MVTITATDGNGASGSVSFYVISDDGNDDVTDVDLLDANGNVTVEGEVDENYTGGHVFGEIKVRDQDHPMHPNGMHLIQILKAGEDPKDTKAKLDDRFEVKYDDAGLPWLALREGKSLDHETKDGTGTETVIIRAVDLNGATNRKGDAFTGEMAHETVTIIVNDKNDAPKANPIGNWWVTAEDGQRADDIGAGSWLKFSLEAEGPGGAFDDPDVGDTLTYTLSGSSPSWLEIDKNGVIQNTKGGVPVRGVHTVTVTASDGEESTSTSFRLAVALSGSDDNYNEDNDEPEIRVTSEVDYPEGSGDRRIATFTVTDEDNDLGHHPFAVDVNSPVEKPRIAGVVDDAGNNVNNTGAAQFLVLSPPVRSGDTLTYNVYIRDTNDNPSRDTTDIPALDHEQNDRITITIVASDGDATRQVTDTIDIRIDDVNEKPFITGGTLFTPPVATGSEGYGVNQSEPLKEILYIKVEEIWSDGQEDESDDLMFDASVSGSWITILHRGEWGDIKEGPNGRDDGGNGDDVEWNDTDGPDDTEGSADDWTAVVIGTDTDAPADNEHVIIIEIDRTESNNGQGDRGSFTLTARDRDGATGTRTYNITPADQDLPAEKAVTLSGSPREDATLRATFNDDKDPDLAGATEPVVVLYQWFHVAVNADGTDGAESDAPFHVSTSNSYQLKQSDVGYKIRVKVKYYEVLNNDRLEGVNQNTAGEAVPNEATTPRPVSNTPDKGSAHITILADTNALKVVEAGGVRVVDTDYGGAGVVPDGPESLSYSWEWSDNGRGGWGEVPMSVGTLSNGDKTLTLDSDGPDSATGNGNGQGKHYRVVVTYDADGPDGAGTSEESVYSDPIQVANIHNGSPTTPQITGSPNPGGTLSVNVPNTSVQWQMRASTSADWTDITTANSDGSLTLTQAHAEQYVRAVVSYHSPDARNPGVTAVVEALPGTTGTGQIGGTQPTGGRPVALRDENNPYEIEASVSDTGHGSTPADNAAGHNLSITRTVPLASLFQYPDTPAGALRFQAAAVDGTGLGEDSNNGVGGTHVFDGDDTAGGVLVFDANTGTLTFNSDVYRTHDGEDGDGQGNVLKLSITAMDDRDDPTPDTAQINLRINVAPTGINFYEDAERNTQITGPHSVDEMTGVSGTGTRIAWLDVQDQNDPMHKSGFGKHEVTPSDGRFEIRFGDANRDGKDDDGRGDTWELWLKPGAHLDYENRADREITLTFKATDEDGAGLSTPGRGAPTLTIMLNDLGDDQGEVDPQKNQPPDSTNDVPGLDDNDTDDGNTPNDTESDTSTDTSTGDDGDVDGGTHPPPPPGMSVGLVDDFIGGMDGFEQDILEDFMLVIDDGIEIA